MTLPFLHKLRLDYGTVPIGTGLLDLPPELLEYIPNFLTDTTLDAKDLKGRFAAFFATHSNFSEFSYNEDGDVWRYLIGAFGVVPDASREKEPFPSWKALFEKLLSFFSMESHHSVTIAKRLFSELMIIDEYGLDESTAYTLQLFEMVNSLRKQTLTKYDLAVICAVMENASEHLRDYGNLWLLNNPSSELAALWWLFQTRYPMENHVSTEDWQNKEGKLRRLVMMKNEWEENKETIKQLLKEGVPTITYGGKPEGVSTFELAHILNNDELLDEVYAQDLEPFGQIEGMSEKLRTVRLKYAINKDVESIEKHAKRYIGALEKDLSILKNRLMQSARVRTENERKDCAIAECDATSAFKSTDRKAKNLIKESELNLRDQFHNYHAPGTDVDPKEVQKLENLAEYYFDNHLRMNNEWNAWWREVEDYDRRAREDQQRTLALV